MELSGNPISVGLMLSVRVKWGDQQSKDKRSNRRTRGRKGGRVGGEIYSFFLVLTSFMLLFSCFSFLLTLFLDFLTAFIFSSFFVYMFSFFISRVLIKDPQLDLNNPFLDEHGNWETTLRIRTYWHQHVKVSSYGNVFLPNRVHWFLWSENKACRRCVTWQSSCCFTISDSMFKRQTSLMICWIVSLIFKLFGSMSKNGLEVDSRLFLKSAPVVVEPCSPVAGGPDWSNLSSCIVGNVVPSVFGLKVRISPNTLQFWHFLFSLFLFLVTFNCNIQPLYPGCQTQTHSGPK